MKPLTRKRLCALIVVLFTGLIHGATQDKQLEELQQLRQVLPPCRDFDQWLETSGSLPPDFNILPAIPYPPDLLSVTENGQSRHLTASEWLARRKQLANLVEEYLLGHAPPPPGNLRAIIEEKKQEEGHETWTVRLEFGPEHAAKLHCWPQRAHPLSIALTCRRIPASVAFSLLVLTFTLAAAPAHHPPNIILILGDDIGYGDFG